VKVSGQLEAPLNIIELGPERQLPKKKKAESQKETPPFLRKTNMKKNLPGLEYAKRVIIYWLPGMPLFPSRKRCTDTREAIELSAIPTFFFKF